MRIEGLETLDYLDNLCQKERFTEQGDAITFESEVNFLSYAELEYSATEGHLSKHCFICRSIVFTLVPLAVLLFWITKEREHM